MTSYWKFDKRTNLLKLFQIPLIQISVSLTLKLPNVRLVHILFTEASMDNVAKLCPVCYPCIISQILSFSRCCVDYSCLLPCGHKTCKLVSKPTASVPSPQSLQNCDAAHRTYPRRSPIKRRTKKQWHTPQVESIRWSDLDQLGDCSDGDGSVHESLCRDCEPQAKLPKRWVASD